MDKLKSWKVTHISEVFRRQDKKKKRKYLYLIVKKNITLTFISCLIIL